MCMINKTDFLWCRNNNWKCCKKTDEPFTNPCMGIGDSLGFWIPGHGFRIPGTGFRPNTLSMELTDSGFESLVGFPIPWAVFHIPKPRIRNSEAKIPQAKLPGFRIQKFSRIPDSEAKICWIPDSTSKNFPDSGFRIPDSGLRIPSDWATFNSQIRNLYIYLYMFSTMTSMILNVP